MHYLEIGNNGEWILNPGVAMNIANFEISIKTLKEKEEELKQEILKEMEEKGIISIKTDELDITYVAPTYRETFDSKKFKEEHQDLYDEYIKMSDVKSSIRIKVK